MWRQAETYLLQTDSLFSANKRRMESECVRHWEMVRLSPPDSTGRQHPSAIIRSRDTCHSRSFSEDSLRRHSSGAVRQKEDNRLYGKTEKQQPPAAVWKWAVGGILLIGGIASIRKRKNSSFSLLHRLP